MAKEFSAAEIFNTRIEDEYTAEQEQVNEEYVEPVIEIKPEKIEEATEEIDDVPLVDISINKKNSENITFTKTEEPDEKNSEAFTFTKTEEVEKKPVVDVKAILSKMPKIKLPERKKREKEPYTEPVVEEPVIEEKPTKKKTVFTLIMVLAAVLVFAIFGVFLFQQYSLVFPSHDDYGYATLSYVYWEEGMWGQNFTMDQLVHYLTEHYNRWGGRILSFGQSILLLREGLDFAQGFHALTLGATFLLAFLFAQNGKKTKLLPVAALFTVSMFGFIGKDVSISGFYWYCAAILYTVPILYVFIGAWLMYIMLLDKREKLITPSKLMMLPFATVIFFFAGFSMEQVGIFAVVTSASMLVYSCFKRRNPFVLLYGVPPLVAAISGCHIMLQAVGNNSRKSMYADYYKLPFSKQILTSGDTIAQTLFSSKNILMIIVLALVTVCAAIFIIRKKKNIFTYALALLNIAFSVFSVAVSANDVVSPKVSVILWIYLVIMAVTVSIWLFMSKKKQDFLLWALFFGSLASQAACLISPIFPGRCLMMFIITLVAVASRTFNEVLVIFEGFEKKKAVGSILSVTLAVVIIGSTGIYQVYNGFIENDAVQQYNNKMLELTGKLYDEFGEVAESIPLMKLKDNTYAGSTQPYNRDLIKDWMKIYYKLPENFQYEDFVYEEYDEERLLELQELLKETENKYLELKNNA